MGVTADALTERSENIAPHDQAAGLSSNAPGTTIGEGTLTQISANPFFTAVSRKLELGSLC